MKQVVEIKPDVVSLIDVDEVYDDKYYLVLEKRASGGPWYAIGLVTRESPGKGYFQVVSFDGFTRGGRYDTEETDSLPGLVLDLVRRGLRVYEFDNIEELAKYLSINP